MAVALPIIGAVQAVTAAGGVAAALTAGFASFSAVAGGFLAGAGLLTGNKKIQRLGTLLSVAGGLANLASGAASAAGSSAAATSAGDVVPPVWDAGEAASTIGNAGAPQLGAAGDLGNAASPSMARSLSAGVDPSQLIDPAWAGDINAAGSLQASPLNTGGGSLVSAARDAGYGLPGMDVVPPAWGETARAVAESAGQIKNTGQLQSLLDAIKQGAGGVNSFIKDNKELVNLGAITMASMNDPRYEALDYAKSLRAARSRNLNSPIALGVRPLSTQGG